MQQFTIKLLTIGLLLSSSIAKAQQVADSSFDYPIAKPAYAQGRGTVITLDEAHFNFHTLGGRYYAFGKLLQKDGYVMQSGTGKFTTAYLADKKILVIANANGDNGPWRLPTAAAFSKEEIQAVEQWVTNGGSLFIIADHMPFAGATASLAAAFGFNFTNGFAMRKDDAAEVFARNQNNLTANAITNGRNNAERIDSVHVFTGQGFLPPPNATVISPLNDGYEILLPSVAWQFSDSTARISGLGLANGAFMRYGKGRLMVMGEAAMFSAQLAGPERRKAGMNNPAAKQNPQFLLNIIHWLDGKL